MSQTLPYTPGSATADTKCAGLAPGDKKKCQADKAALRNAAKPRTDGSLTPRTNAPTTTEQAIISGLQVVSDVVSGLAGDQRATDLKVTALTKAKPVAFSLKNPDGGPNFVTIGLLAVGGWFLWKWFFK
jgi:hypothetical protein